jgi:hypothetical protein
MAEYIIDTNVPIIAQGDSDYTEDCQERCAHFMESIKYETHIVVIDSDYDLLVEYEKNATRYKQDSYLREFVKWLHRHKDNSSKVKKVNISQDSEKGYIEVPQNLHALNFDWSDRKFIAVAIANDKIAPIIEAGDSKWIGWESALNNEGISVDFLCKKELWEKYNQKKKP